MSLNGYYVAAYVSPPGNFAFVSGRHDQCVALFLVTDDGVSLVRYWELERYSGFKHHNVGQYEDPDTVTTVLAHLLAEEGLTTADVRAVWGTPGVSGCAALPPSRFPTDGLPIHAICHIYTGLYLTDAFRAGADVLCLAMDGGPDYTLETRPPRGPKYAGAMARGGELTYFPIESPGPLWSVMEKIREVEPGTLMALASATDAVFDFADERVLEHRYYGDAKNRRSEAPEYRVIEELLATGEAALRSGELSRTPGFTDVELVHSAVGKVIQRCSERIVQRNVDAALARFGIRPEDCYLSLTGGYALNCPSNSAILEGYRFRGLLTPPCPNDAGQALGIGLYALDSLGVLRSRPFVHTLPYAGADPAVEGRTIAGACDGTGFDAEVFAADLRSAPVAWIAGRAEVGPRALGHRSLLASPEQVTLKDELNRIKDRQWWRPVAPIVLEEAVRDWFDGARRSPYMLQTFRVREGVRGRIPAVCHLDGSARVQTLSAADDALLHRAVSAFAGVTGVPVVCNTSLNGRGEPMVNSVDEAVDFCRRAGIGVLYVDGRRYKVAVGVRWQARTRPLHAHYADQAWDASIFDDPDLDFDLLYLIFRHPALADHRSWSTTAARARRALRLASSAERAEIAVGGRRLESRIRSHFANLGRWRPWAAEEEGRAGLIGGLVSGADR